MGDWHGPQGPFDIPDVPSYVPRRLKPWLFIVFVLIIQFSGGVYLAAASDMVGAALWSVFMLCFTFVCVYGDYYDWWDAPEITAATIIGLASMAVNLWRASFLHHPYVSFTAMKNRNVIRATLVYLVFFTLMATEHVFEHSYAATQCY